MFFHRFSEYFELEYIFLFALFLINFDAFFPFLFVFRSIFFVIFIYLFVYVVSLSYFISS